MHVAQSASRSLRLAVGPDRFETVNVAPEDWVNHPAGDDVAIVEIDPKDGWEITGSSWLDVAPTPARMQELKVGVGDEVFMLGRFIAHQGMARSQPLARFGNIAMMPGELVRDGRGFDVEAFLVEMRSLSGFSGSPVFVYLGPVTYRGNATMMPFYSETIGLIGIDSGHKTTQARVEDPTSGKETDLRVNLNTGVSIVVPTWKIKDVLNDERLCASRGGTVPERA